MQHKPLEIVSTPSSAKVKPRRTASQWQDLMKDYDGSGLSQQVYCQRHSIALSTFYSWRNKLRPDNLPQDNQSQQNQFVELTPPKEAVAVDNSWDMELSFANGMTIRLRT